MASKKIQISISKPKRFVRTASWLKKYEQADSLPESNVKAVYLEALREFKVENFGNALEKFIEVIRTDRSYDEDGARKACIAIFRMLGDEHEIARTWRREFSSALNA